MPDERYYYDGTFSLGEELELQDQEFHHLAHVMRSKLGDHVEVVNGHGALAEAGLIRLEKKKAVLRIEGLNLSPPPGFQPILAQAIPRINRLDFILEKGTELGMTQLWLFPGDHSERKSLTDHQKERMEAVVISAMKQCGRLYKPGLIYMPPLKKWPSQDLPLFYGDPNSSAPALFTSLNEVSPQKQLILFIGPESGFSIEEEQKLKTLGAHAVKLHENVLRTDTAALAALTVVNHWSLLHRPRL